MAKKKRKKGKGLFKKALKAGAILALAPMLPAMIGLIVATTTTNPMAAKALRKKLKKKKLKNVVQEFINKVVKKKKNLEDLESTFDFDTLKSLSDFQEVKHFQGETVRSFEDMLQSALDGADNLHKDHMEDHFVQAIADIVKMVFSFFKGLKKKKDKGESVSPAEDVAIKESDVDEEKADAAVEQVKKAEGGALNLKTILFVVGGLVGGVLIFKAISK